MTYLDSTGENEIKKGSIVKFRGREYVIDHFEPGKGRYGWASIHFTMPHSAS